MLSSPSRRASRRACWPCTLVICARIDAASERTRSRCALSSRRTSLASRNAAISRSIRAISAAVLCQSSAVKSVNRCSSRKLSRRASRRCNSATVVANRLSRSRILVVSESRKPCTCRRLSALSQPSTHRLRSSMCERSSFSWRSRPRLTWPRMVRASSAWRNSADVAAQTMLKRLAKDASTHSAKGESALTSSFHTSERSSVTPGAVGMPRTR